MDGRSAGAERQGEYPGSCLRVSAWRSIRELEPEMDSIQGFQMSHKLFLMSLDPALYRKLGALAANSEKRPPESVLVDYRKLFLVALCRPWSVGKRVNVLQHMAGYFRGRLEAPERRSLARMISDYQQGRIPFLAVIALIRALAMKYKVDYLLRQSLVTRYPFFN